MKPIRLILSAFGSYGGCECVEFDKMQQGLFLITGDTGAGKTTIFDGISYALYGQTSGRRRDGDMMHSQYAKDTEETYVEFTFVEGGKTYTIRRNPNWMRRSKRKNKDGEYALTKVSAKVELTMPDGKLFVGKIKEIDQKIVEIIGMDMNQFSQVSMISQGDFMKLLLASSKERKEIFSKIFPTQIYWRIQMQLKDQEKHLYGQLENIRRRCQTEMENVQCLPESQYQEVWKLKGTFSDVDNSESMTLLQEIISETTEKEKEIHQKIQNCENVMGLYRQKEEKKERCETLSNEVSRLEKDIQVLIQSLEERQNALNTLRETYDQTSQEKQNHLFSIRQEMPEYDRLEEERENQKQVLKNLLEVQQSIEKRHNEIEKLLKEMESLQSIQERLKDRSVQKVEIEQRWIQHKEKLERMKTLLDKRGQWNQTIKTYKNTKDQLEVRLKSYQEASRYYDTLYEIFIASQAGLMAKELKDGEPCPVCGSLHHPSPHPIENLDEVVDQKMIEDKRKFRDHEQTAVEQARESFTKISDQLIAFKHQILQEASHFLEDGENLLKSNTFWTTISKMVQDENTLCAQLNESLNRCVRDIKTYETSQKQMQMIQERQVHLQEEYHTCIQNEAIFKTKQEQYETIVRQLAEKLSYKSKKEAEDCLKKIENEIKQSKLLLENEEKQLNESKERLQSNQGQLTERKIQWQRMREEFQKAEDALQEKLKESNLSCDIDYKAFEHMKKVYSEQEKQAYGIRQSNQMIYKRLKDIFVGYKDEQMHFAYVRNLSRIANGELPGAAKIDFQTYMQRRYFKQMVNAANRRLAVMSRNQFLLECRDMNQLGKQGEVGLDLDVYSLVNDQVRDIKTLSGGESFMAALALALGMADVIQQEAGKIHVDTLFIDEGFGSLDENSRNQAVQILNDLAGGERLVGIISHVHELKEQIEQKIQVEKTEQGSKIVACYSM